MSDRFWFPVKLYGWGWGLPVRWQGWAVLAGYAGLVYAGVSLFRSRAGLMIYLLGVTALLIAVIAAKGERPTRWRWGKR